MDTSETYTKMCKQTKEIQTIWHSKELRPDKRHVDNRALARHYEEGYDGSWICHNNKYIILVDYEYETQYKLADIWLPRQDQLQEMIGDFFKQKSLITGYGYNENEYNEFMGLSCTCYWDIFTSMEQLWLAIVMKEKYGKVWDGKEWSGKVLSTIVFTAMPPQTRGI